MTGATNRRTNDLHEVHLVVALYDARERRDDQIGRLEAPADHHVGTIAIDERAVAMRIRHVESAQARRAGNA